MKKKTSRTIQAEKTKKLILDETLKLMKIKNFDDISVQEICKAAGVTTGAFYHHYNSKAQIIVAAYLQFDEYFQEKIMSEISTSGAKDEILRYLSEQGAYAVNIGIDIIRNIYKAQVDNASDFLLSPERRIHSGLNELVCKGLDSGELKSSRPVEQIAEELLIISRGVIYNWALCHGDYDLVAKLRSIVSAYLEGM